MKAYMDIEVDFPAGFYEEMERWIADKRFCEKESSLSDLTELTGVSADDLKLYLKFTVGMDFISWRNFLRIEEAKRILLDEFEVSARIIGESVGFGDKANFHRQFIRFVGCTPNQWRIADGSPSRL